MANRWDRDRDERNRGEFSGNADFGGDYARDTHRGGLGDDYARDGRWGGHGARGEFYGRGAGQYTSNATLGFGPMQGRSTFGNDNLGGSAATYGGDDPLAGIDFRGKGPRNWDRSNDRLRALVNDRLTDHAGIDATNIDVSVENEEVTLSGTVGSRWERRLAEDIAWHCRGVHDVHNRLTVSDRETQIGKASE